MKQRLNTTTADIWRLGNPQSVNGVSFANSRSKNELMMVKFISSRPAKIKTIRPDGRNYIARYINEVLKSETNFLFQRWPLSIECIVESFHFHVDVPVFVVAPKFLV